MVAARASLSDVWSWLAQIPDPEIPVISILDLGIVRAVAWDGPEDSARLHVTITPTYSGCPAMRVIERSVVDALVAHGVTDAVVDVVLAPAWTTDWLTPVGREKLRAYGISPPRVRAVRATDALDLTDFIGFADELATCPRCGRGAVTLTSRFGSTPCKSLYVCRSCKEPFDHFKSH